MVRWRACILYHWKGTRLFLHDWNAITNKCRKVLFIYRRFCWILQNIGKQNTRLHATGNHEKPPNISFDTGKGTQHSKSASLPTILGKKPLRRSTSLRRLSGISDNSKKIEGEIEQEKPDLRAGSRATTIYRLRPSIRTIVPNLLLMCSSKTNSMQNISS